MSYEDFQRPTKESWYLDIAEVVSSRTNCIRRAVGAIITDGEQEVIAYNGTPSGTSNCFEGGCLRCSGDAPSGSGYEYCLCLHAEDNAIFKAAKAGINFKEATLYVTIAPCPQCMKKIVHSGIKEIIHSGTSVPMEITDDHLNMIRDKQVRVWSYTDGEYCDDPNYHP